MGIMKNILYRLRGGSKTVEQLERLGFKHGDNLNIMFGAIVDCDHCYLISCGNDVTLAPRSYLLAHDASTKNELGYTRVGRVSIGNNVFIGANAIVLPGVSIGDNSIVAAGAVVSRSLPGNGVYAGVPAKQICSYQEYMERMRLQLSESPVFDKSYRRGASDEGQVEEVKAALQEYEYGFME